MTINERQELKDLVEILEGTLAAVDIIDSSGQATFQGPTRHFREAIFHTEDFKTATFPKGLGFTNPANTSLIGRIGMRNNANGDFIMAIRDRVTPANTLTGISFSNVDSGEIVMRIEGNSCWILTEDATDREVRFTGVDGKDARILLGNQTGDSAYLSIQAENNGAQYIEWDQVYTLGRTSEGVLQLTSSTTLGEADKNIFTTEGISAPFSFVINEDGRDLDFRVEGDTDTDLLHTDASTEAVGIGVAAALAKLHVDQKSTTGAKPVITLDQADVDEDYFKFVGTSDTSADRALVDAANFTTPGAIVGWLKINIDDVQATNPITDGDYYIPFYAVPTA